MSEELLTLDEAIRHLLYETKSYFSNQDEDCINIIIETAKEEYYLKKKNKKLEAKVKDMESEYCKLDRRVGNILKPEVNASIYMRDKNDALQTENTALRAELEELKKANEWQPIETASRDGTGILVYDGDQIIVVCFMNEKWSIGTEDGHRLYLINKPTHWHPLPTPPEEESE